MKVEIKLDSVCRLIRASAERFFSSETANPGTSECAPPVVGHCAAVAIIVQSLIGGDLVSATVNGQSHGLNKIHDGLGVWYVDLTGDQFGFPAVQIRHGIDGELYEGCRVRFHSEFKEETLARSSKLMGRMLYSWGTGFE